jgi:trehalose 6-phosphate phosphatase
MMNQDAGSPGPGPPPPLPATAALYVDFDGTLAEIALRPDHVVVRQSLPELLAALYGLLGGAVAVVTGRLLADVDALLAPLWLPGAGLHGAELRLDPHDTRRMREPGGMPELVDALRERFGADPRLLTEDKGSAVALHYRLAPERAAECIAAMRALATAPELEIILGRMVVEARPRGASKGGALRRLAAHPPFAERLPVFVGDDITDEDGFRAAAELGGCGVKVGAGETVARYRIGEVQEVHDWLLASLRALEHGGSA